MFPRGSHAGGALVEGRAWYKIFKNEGTGPVRVYLYDEIGYWGITADDFIEDLVALDATAIDLHINSPGGGVFEGFAIFEALRDHTAKVTTHVDSLAASIASVIALAGDEVVFAPTAEFMVHDASGLCIGNASDMQDMVNQLNRESDRIANVYAERAGGTADEWRARMRAETWFSATEALEAGLADRIKRRRKGKGEELPEEDLLNRVWDLSIFQYPGRKAAPSPAARLDNADREEPVQPDEDEPEREAADATEAAAPGKKAPPFKKKGAPDEGEPEGAAPSEPDEDTPPDEEPEDEPEDETDAEPEAAAGEDQPDEEEDPDEDDPDEEEEEGPGKKAPPFKKKKKGDPPPSDTWAGTVAHLITPPDQEWARATAHLTSTDDFARLREGLLS